MQKTRPDRRLGVLTAATELFSDKSFHDVKLEEVAERADVGKGTIYTYFKSKDELFVQCLVHDIPAFEERVEKIIASGETFADALKKLISMQFEFVRIKGPLVKQVMVLGPQLKISDKQFKLLTEVFERAVARLARFFQKAMDEGILSRCLTAGQMAIMFQGIFDLNVTFSLFKEPIMRQDDVFTCIMRIFGNQGENS